MNLMMKILSNRRRSALSLLTVLGIAGLQPITASAAFEDRLENRKAAVTDQLCSRLDTRSTEILKRITERIGQKDGKQDDRLETLTGKRATWDEKRTSNRDEREAYRNKRYANLTERANTEEEKAAVKAFEDAVEAATETRQKSTDSAVNEFRKAMDTSISGRQGGIDSVLVEFKSDVETAFKKAVSSCDNGTAVKTVRETLRSDLKNARNELKAGYESLDKARDPRPDLVAARNAKIKTASEAFKASVESAKAELKKAFQR